MKKRILSIMLVLCMVIGMMPAAFADDSSPAPSVPDGKVMIQGADTVYDTVAEAVTDAESGAEILLGAGAYTLYGVDSSSTTTGKDLTFAGQGADSTTWNIGAEVPDPANLGTEYNGDYSFDGAGTVTFQDMTMQSGSADYLGFIRPSRTVVKNCTLNGKTFYWGYDSATFTNCTFNCPEGDYAMWVYSSQEATFDGCTFNSSGKVLNIYREKAADYTCKVSFNNCTVNSTAENKVALNINDSTGQKYEISASNVTLNGVGTSDVTGSALYGFSSAGNNAGNTTIYVDDTLVFTNGSAPVCKICDTAYGTLAAAIDAAEDGDTITLLSNMSVSGAYTKVDKSLTIDFDGHTMTSDDGGFDLYGGTTGDATLTLQNGTLETNKWSVWVQTGANLVVAKDMALNATSTDSNKGGITVQNNGSIVTVYGKVTAAGGATISGIGNASDGGVTINIEDGAEITNTNSDGLGIYYPNTSELNINGGTISGATGVYVKSGTVNVTGGQIFGTGAKIDYEYRSDGATATGNALVIDRCGYPGGDPVANITGGTFTSTNNSAVGSYAGGTVTEPATNFISGGSFSSDPSDYVTGDYKAVQGEDGLYSVTMKDAVATIGETKYTSLAKAIAAAKDGDTVTLVADTTEDITISGTKELTLDLGSKTLTNTGSGKATLFIGGGASVSVKDGSIIGGASYYNIMCGTEEDPTGSIEFTNVTATAGNTGSSMADNWGTMTIHSGKYTGGMNTVKNDPTGVLTIEDGTFELTTASSGYTAVVLNYGVTTISNGNFTQSVTSAKWKNPQVIMNGKDGDVDPLTTITGGTFTNKFSSSQCNPLHAYTPATKSSFRVSGGTFSGKTKSADPSAYLVDGYAAAKLSNYVYQVVTPKTITITPSENGSVTASATTAKLKDSITLTVTPAEGYELDTLSYTAEGADKATTISAKNKKFTMPDANVTVTATFKLAEYTVSIADDIQNGSLEANPEKAHMGDTVTAWPSPSAGYEPDTVTYTVKGSDEVTEIHENDDAAYTFTMPAANVTLNATFKLALYGIDIDENIEHGSLSTDKYEASIGTPIVVTAEADPGYELEAIIVTSYNDETVNVTDGTFTMPAGSVIVSATFKKIEYNVTVAEDLEHGKISTVEKAPWGEPVTVTATPDEGYELDTITVTTEDNQPVEVTDGKFTMPTGNVTVSATFKKSTYTVSVDKDIKNGKVAVDHDTASMDETVTVTATPDEGYELEAVTVTAGGKDVSVEDGKFTMPAGNVTVSASFTKSTYTISVDKSIKDGKVAVEPATASMGDPVTVTATPDEGYELDAITVTADGKDVAVEDGKFTMPAGNVTVSASFKKTVYTVSVDKDIKNGKVTVEPATASMGDSVTVTATPDEGYELDQLTYTAVGTEEAAEITKNDDGVYAFTMPAGNVTVNATFKKSVYTISLDPTMENGTIITSKKTASMGDVISVSIEPATGYSVNRLYYTEEGNPSPGFIPVTENDTLAFTMPASNVTIHATFIKSGYAAAIAKTKNGTVSITSNGIPVINGVHYEDVIAITATPDEGYELDTITVITDDNQPVEVKDGKFTMPNTSVVITVTFKKKAVTPPAEPSISTVVSVATDVSEDLSSADKKAIEDVLDNASVTGIEKAVSADDILEAAGVDEADTKGKQVEIEITTKVVAEGADLSAGTLTFSAAPVATITIDGKEVSKDVPVTNDMLSGKEITIKLPLPKDFTPIEIIHISNDGLRQRYSKQDFKIEDAADGGKVAVLKITHFSQFILNAETHVHAWDEGTVTTEPTATVDGTMHYVCTVCGDEKDEVIPAVPATELTLDPASIRLTAGQTKALTLTAKPENATGTAVWSSSNPAVATVDEKGNVTAVAAGTATITAALGTQAAVCTVSVVCGIDTCQYYTDVDAGAWYHPAVDFVTEHKLMQGVDAKTFVPDHNLTRAQLAQVLYNMENPKGTASKKSFKDVKHGAWYYDAVIWAADNGIVKGFEDGRFYPNRPVTREQMVTMLYRYMQFKGIKVDTADEDWKSFTDYAKVSDWAQDAMAWAVDSGVVNGVENNRLAPSNTAKRSQVAKIIMEITVRYELA